MNLIAAARSVLGLSHVEVAAETGARLVSFDRAAYETWRAEHGRADTRLLRSE